MKKLGVSEVSNTAELAVVPLIFGKGGMAAAAALLSLLRRLPPFPQDPSCHSFLSEVECHPPLTCELVGTYLLKDGASK